MNKKLLIPAISTLLLTGCSTPTPESQPEYDQVELIQYENCLNLLNRVFADVALRKAYTEDLMASLVKQLQGECEYLKPVKK
jgi:uncharacterized lipoprotein YajG